MARCLRRILHVPAAFVSRVFNKTVFARAGVRPFSQQLLKHQYVLLRKVACSPDGNPLRQDTFADASFVPQIGRFVRRVGRPKQEWTNQLMREGRERMGAMRFQTLLSDQTAGSAVRWKTEVEKMLS